MRESKLEQVINGPVLCVINLTRLLIIGEIMYLILKPHTVIILLLYRSIILTSAASS